MPVLGRSTLAGDGGASRKPILIAARVGCGRFVRGWGVGNRRFGADLCKFSGNLLRFCRISERADEDDVLRAYRELLSWSGLRGKGRKYAWCGSFSSALSKSVGHVLKGDGDRLAVSLTIGEALDCVQNKTIDNYQYSLAGLQDIF